MPNKHMEGAPGWPRKILSGRRQPQEVVGPSVCSHDGGVFTREVASPVRREPSRVTSHGKSAPIAELSRPPAGPPASWNGPLNVAARFWERSIPIVCPDEQRLSRKQPSLVTSRVVCTRTPSSAHGRLSLAAGGIRLMTATVCTPHTWCSPSAAPETPRLPVSGSRFSKTLICSVLTRKPVRGFLAHQEPCSAED